MTVTAGVGKAGSTVQQQDFDRTGAHSLGPHFVLTPDDGDHANAGDTNSARVQRV
jgi:hypothetical protein